MRAEILNWNDDGQSEKGENHMLKELVYSCRTYRRFDEDVRMTEEELRELVDLGRMTAFSANSQSLKFAIYHTREDAARIYPSLIWAAALKDWDGPVEGERPAAYIVILSDLTMGPKRAIESGITAQTMMLGAVEKGYGGCMLGSVQRAKLAETLGIDQERYSIELVLVLGKPKEEVKVVPVGENGDTTYYRDENQVHYVPKRSLEDVLYS